MRRVGLALLPPDLRGLGLWLVVSCVLHLLVLAGLPLGSWSSKAGGLLQQDLQVRLMREPEATTTDFRIPSAIGVPASQIEGANILSRAFNSEEKIARLPSVEEVGPPYPPPAPRYQAASGVDVPPVVMSSIEFSPRAIDEALRPGRAVLVLLVSASGDVDEVLVESSGLSAELIELAVRAFREAHFSPGIKKGVSVPTRLRIEITSGFQRNLPGGAPS